MQYLLPILLCIPLIGAIGGAMLPRWARGKRWGILISFATAFTGAVLAYNFDWKTGGMQFVYDGPGIEAIGFKISLGVDGISLLLVLMTCFLHPLAVTSSFRSIRVRTREHYAWFNLLLLTMLGVFVSRDLLLFYFFFELSLVPLFFIVSIWGGHDRRAAAAKLFIYTFAGGVLTLTAIIYLGTRAGTFDMSAAIAFAQTSLTSGERFWVLIGLLCGLGVKTPLVPFHTWLPLAHTEAPTAGSVDLAALVLKLGTYGLIRIALPVGIIGPNGELRNVEVYHVLAMLCVIGVIFGALAAWVQTDIKKLVAYSSVSHLGFCVLGMLALNDIGMQGSVYYMVNHGINTGALFLCIGMIYNRFHTRDINELSGLGRAMPKLAFFMVFFVMASVGLPGTNGFVSEFLCILGAFTNDSLRLYAIIASIGIVLGAVYLLHMTAKVIFGPLRYPVLHGEIDTHETIHPKYVPGADITGREVAVLTPLAMAVLLLGIFPTPFLKSMEQPLRDIQNSATVATMNHVPAVALVEAGFPRRDTKEHE